MENQKLKLYDHFTNLYKLSKTLRFELIPHSKTSEALKLNNVFEKDQTIDNSYNQAKFYFDELHRRFVKFALNEESCKKLDFTKLYSACKKQKENRNEWINAKKTFYNEIMYLFDSAAESWKNKYKKKNIKIKTGDKGLKFIMSANVLEILKYEFPAKNDLKCIEKGWPSLFVKDLENPPEKKYIFDSFDKFTTYLTSFQKTRENFYKVDDTSSSIASRIIQNFIFFVINIENYKNKISKFKLELGIDAEVEEIFNVQNYYKYFLQEKINEYNENLGSLNKKIKELRDKKIKEDEYKKTDFPLFKNLYKQILGEVKKEKQIIESSKDVYPIFNNFVNIMDKFVVNEKNIFNDLFAGEYKDEYYKIYIKNSAINTIVRKWMLPEHLYIIEMALPQEKKNKNEIDTPKIKTFVSLADLKKVINGFDDSVSMFKNEYNGIVAKQKSKWDQFLAIWKFEFESLFESDKDITITKQKEIVKYNQAVDNAKRYLSKNEPYSGKLEEIKTIKNLADGGLKIYQMVKYLSLDVKNQNDIPTDISSNFYQQYDEAVQLFNVGANEDFIAYYNAFRNFITKKLSETNKIKLNFDCGQLLGGFDQNMEENKLGVILRKENKYYLTVINKDTKDVFDEKKNKNEYDEVTDRYYEKMVYKLFPDAKRMVPKIAFAKKNFKKFKCTDEILKIKEEFSKFQKIKLEDKRLWQTQFDKEKMTKLIAYYQKCLLIGGYQKTFEFRFKSPADYKNIGEFNDDVDRQGYLLKFVKISEKYIEDMVNKGNIYLFQISNKDFKKKKTSNSKDDLQTLYFKNIFSSNNLENTVIKLSGGAEIFKRDAVKNLKIKKDNNGKKINEHKRYGEEKLLFHLSILINMKAGSVSQKKLNTLVREKISEKLAEKKDSVNIIGIDRGEKHLAYYSVITPEGKIIETKSLNVINGIDYYSLLKIREDEKLLNKQTWEPITKIKDLKRGYISNVIYEISKLAVKYNAIVVLEDLNMRFKQVRSAIEKSIYQQLEKALIDKFSYLVDKNKPNDKIGGVVCGYQLSAPFESFQKMGKQSGVIFYTQANYTSVTDPLTGFRKNVYVGNSSPIGNFDKNPKTIKGAISLFKEISYDKSKESFYFVYNTKDFIKNKKAKAKSKLWKVYANIPRIHREKINGFWEYKSVNPNELLVELFKIWSITVKSNLIGEIQKKDKLGELTGKKVFFDKERDFYHSLIYIFNLMLQLRNSFSKKSYLNDKNELSKRGEDIDFIASPVDPFFTTNSTYSNVNFSKFVNRYIGTNKEDFVNNYNGDSNGAYNIARKGAIILDRIQADYEKTDLFIANNQWDEYTQ